MQGIAESRFDGCDCWVAAAACSDPAQGAGLGFGRDPPALPRARRRVQALGELSAWLSGQLVGSSLGVFGGFAVFARGRRLRRTCGFALRADRPLKDHPRIRKALASTRYYLSLDTQVTRSSAVAEPSPKTPKGETRLSRSCKREFYEFRCHKRFCI
jgi:hypothetical protein